MTDATNPFAQQVGGSSYSSLTRRTSNRHGYIPTIEEFSSDVNRMVTQINVEPEPYTHPLHRSMDLTKVEDSYDYMYCRRNYPMPNERHALVFPFTFNPESPYVPMFGILRKQFEVETFKYYSYEFGKKRLNASLFELFKSSSNFYQAGSEAGGSKFVAAKGMLVEITEGRVNVLAAMTLPRDNFNVVNKYYQYYSKSIRAEDNTTFIREHASSCKLFVNKLLLSNDKKYISIWKYFSQLLTEFHGDIVLKDNLDIFFSVPKFPDFNTIREQKEFMLKYMTDTLKGVKTW